MEDKIKELDERLWALLRLIGAHGFLMLGIVGWLMVITIWFSPSNDCTCSRVQRVSNEVESDSLTSKADGDYN